MSKYDELVILKPQDAKDNGLIIEFINDTGYATTVIRNKTYFAIATGLLEKQLFADIKNNSHTDYMIDTKRKCLVIHYLSHSVRTKIILPFRKKIFPLTNEDIVKLMQISTSNEFVCLKLKKDGLIFHGSIHDNERVMLKLLNDIKSGKHTDFNVVNKCENGTIYAALEMYYDVHSIKVCTIINLSCVENCVIL